MKIKTLLMMAAAFAAVWSVSAAENFASKSRWIWFDAPAITTGDCYYRLTLDLKDKVESLEFITYLDDSGYCCLNGSRVSGSWTARGEKVLVNAQKFVLTKGLKPGKNVIAFKVTNVKHLGGFMALGKIIYASGKAEYIHSDKSWKATGTMERNWHKVDFDDSNWKPAKEFLDVNAAPWAKISLVQTVCRTPEEIAQDSAK